MVLRVEAQAENQPNRDNHCADNPSSPLTRRREAFDGDGRCHKCHRAQIHDASDHKNGSQIRTAVTAVQAEP